MRLSSLNWQRMWPFRPTLRARLTLWTGGLILLSTIVVVALINVAAAVVSPRVDVPPLALAATAAVEPGLNSPASRPPAATPALVEPAEARRATLYEVRSISALALGLVSVVGALGAYGLAGRALRPVRQISQAAQQISAGSLDTRLALQGPDDELKRLADAFDGMLDRLEAAFAQQGRFVADAAHELRTPLSTLRTNLEVANANPQATAEDYRDMARAMEHQLTRLERLVADLLLLATDEQPASLSHGEVALGPLIEEVLSDLQPLAEANQVALRMGGEADVTVRGDEGLLMRAFSNLVENGIRYNRPGGEVALSISRQDAWALVAVADTGIGIPAEEQVRIFDRFCRVDRSRSRHQGGAGLGLSIVAHILRQHGGDVQVESVVGEGSRFTVRLPIQSP